MDRFMIGSASEILVGPGLAFAEVLPQRSDRSAAIVVTQPGAREVAAGVIAAISRSGVRADLVVLPDGEAAKTLAEVERMYERFDAFGLHRADTVVAVGGGSLTDAAGFAAATYLRGVEAVYVSTTLLGAVDAAIGGKTGVNLAGKNLVGSFRHPSRVVLDTTVIGALPEELLRQGAAEALKTGLVGDPLLVDLYERDGLGSDVAEVVRRSVAVKAAIVNEDFREAGTRAFLNYGHTIGHGIEVVGGLSHGEAVAVGMVAAATASERLTGYDGAARQRAITSSLGLPVAAPGLDGDEVRDLIAKDKKRGASGLRMVLLEDVGRPVVLTVEAGVVDEALAAIGL